jgi:hypothetical protein
VDNTGADEPAVSEALTRAQQARSQAETERTKASAARTDEVLAGAAVAGANRQDRATQTAQGEPAWDSAERGQQLARGWKARETVKRSTPGSCPKSSLYQLRIGPKSRLESLPLSFWDCRVKKGYVKT